jgi:mannose-6-phosphate isomerase-like protein (cupin superfamily)
MSATGAGRGQYSQREPTYSFKESRGMKRSIVMFVVSVVIALASLASLAQSADPPGFAMWTADELRRYAESIKTPTAETLPRRGGQFGALVLRDDKNGPFEIHEAKHDIYFVVAGQGILTVGGMLTDSKTTGAGEIRGTAIQGGVKKRIGPGDIVLIPAKMAHHLTTEPGTDMTYFLMKLDAK